MPANSDKDVVMGSSSTPATLSTTQPSTSKTRDNLEIQEKYRKLKRRFFELEEKHKETSNELQRSGERNVRMREERDHLLERIMELEKQQQELGLNASPGSSSSLTLPQASALPRTLLNARARSSFEENLRKAIEEDDDDEDDALLPSRRMPSPPVRRDQEGGGSGNIGRSKTRAGSKGKARADIPNGITHAPSGPRTRSKRPVDSEEGVASPKRHKSRPSTSSLLDSSVPIVGEELVVSPVDENNSHEEGEGSSARSLRPRAAKSKNQGKQTPTPKSSPVESAAPHTARVLRNRGENASPVLGEGYAILDALPEPAPTTPPPIEDVVMNEPSPPTPPQDPLTPSDLTPAPASTTAPSASRPSSSDQTDIAAIVKVAEAASATQNAADATSSTATTIPEDPTPDSNIDPSLTEKPTSPDPSIQESDKESASSGPSRKPAQPQATSHHPLTGNPYLSLSTIMLPKSNPSGGPTPTPTSGHPMFMNPYMYYPSPITPVTGTPNTPSYPYNPYFYLTGPPVMPGPPPMYPPGANAPPPPTPTSSTQSRPPPQPEQPRAKPKRLKAHTVTSKSYSIPLVPRDKNGKPMLPLNVGIMTVINLGDVCMREHFHTERYIFPVGYEVTRRYLSTINPNIEVVYHCTILDGGDGPKFQIVPSDTADRPVIAGTATGAWSSIVKQANAIRNRQHSNSVSGPDFFGLGQNTIKHLIQELPNADRLRDYVWQNFIEGGPLGGRHAAVIPALPEEYDAALPRGPMYHSPLEREKRLRQQQQQQQQSQQPDENGANSSTAAGAGNTSPGELPKGLSHYPQHIIAAAAAQQILEHGQEMMAGIAHAHAQAQAQAQARAQGSRPGSEHPGTPSIAGRSDDSPPGTTASATPVPGGGGGSQVGDGSSEAAAAAVAAAGLMKGAIMMGGPTPGGGPPVGGEQQQSPTPITPNTPAAASLASLMQAYRQPPPP